MPKPVTCSEQVSFRSINKIKTAAFKQDIVNSITPDRPLSDLNSKLHAILDKHTSESCSTGNWPPGSTASLISFVHWNRSVRELRGIGTSPSLSFTSKFTSVQNVKLQNLSTTPKQASTLPRFKPVNRPKNCFATSIVFSERPTRHLCPPSLTQLNSQTFSQNSSQTRFVQSDPLSSGLLHQLKWTLLLSLAHLLKLSNLSPSNLFVKSFRQLFQKHANLTQSPLHFCTKI